jgi:hypothetical protein
MPTLVVGRVRIVHRGTYSAAIAYDHLDVVEYAGSGYITKQATTPGILPTDTAYWDLLVSRGDPGPEFSEGFEIYSKNLKSYPATFNYTGSDLTSVVYDLGGGLSVTKTLHYTAGDLTSIVLSGDTPVGINLTKTLTYTAGNLTGVSYS